MSRKIFNICILLVTSWVSVQAGNLEVSEIKVSLPNMLFSGLANPFPAIYVFDGDRNLLGSGIGKDAPIFSKNGLDAFLQMDLNDLKDVKKAALALSTQKQELLWQNLPAQALGSARRIVFYITLDPRLSECTACRVSEVFVRESLQKSKIPVKLVRLNAYHQNTK